MAGDSFSKLTSSWDKLVNGLRPNRFGRYWFELLNFLASIITIGFFFIAALSAERPEVWYVIILLIYLGIGSYGFGIPTLSQIIPYEENNSNYPSYYFTF